MILGVLASGQKVQIEPFDLLFREIQLLHSFINPSPSPARPAMIASGAVDVGPLISRTLPLSEAADAIIQPARPERSAHMVIPQ